MPTPTASNDEQWGAMGCCDEKGKAAATLLYGVVCDATQLRHRAALHRIPSQRSATRPQIKGGGRRDEK